MGLPRTPSQSIKAGGFAKRGAARRLFSSCEQHGDYAGDENAVECARTTDRGDRRPELRNRAEVENIRAEEASHGARDIRDRGGAAAIEYDSEHRSQGF